MNLIYLLFCACISSKSIGKSTHGYTYLSRKWELGGIGGVEKSSNKLFLWYQEL